MQSANRLHKALNTGNGRSFGAWQMLSGANQARTIARCGFDWVCVDCEHGELGDREMHEAVAAIAATGVSPIVRIPANEGWMAKRALDAGAHGLLVPLIYSAEDARRTVDFCKFPPRGHRGFGSPFPMQNFSNNPSITEYLQQANDSLVTIVQIETKEALECVDEIAKVDGIDVLLVGPFDLANNIGYPIITEMHEELVKAIEKIHKAVVDNGKRIGIYCTSGEQARMYADQGFHMISVISDMQALPTILTSSLKAANGSYTHATLNVAKSGASKLAGPYFGASDS